MPTSQLDVPADAPTDHAGAGRAGWRQTLAPYATPSVPRSILNLCTSVLPYLVLFAAMYWSLSVSYLLTLALAVPAAGFLVRVYIVFHDCTHGSFLPTKRQNEIVGTLAGLLTFANFLAWRHNHARHHATAGDLDRRGAGDVECKTVAEYRAMTPRERRLYRAFRNPWVMFGIGPFVSLVISPRIVPKGARPRIRRSVLLTNLALAALVAGLCVVMGPWAFLLVQVPIVWIGGAFGIWLFYVQHQFEDVYWEKSHDWDYADAALQGSSYLKLPKVLQFFSGNIGLHHVHHLVARIPNYNLQRAHDEHPELFDAVPTLTLADGLRAVRLKLYDEDLGRMVGFPDLPDEAAEPPAARPGRPAAQSQ